MNYNDYKYVLEGGCSYGQFLNMTIGENDFTRYIRQKYNFNDDIIETEYDNIIFINIASPSQSIYYIKDSIIDTVNSLLNLGVANENIYVVSDLTDFNRTLGLLPNNFYNKKKNINYDIYTSVKKPNKCNLDFDFIEKEYKRDNIFTQLHGYNYLNLAFFNYENDKPNDEVEHFIDGFKHDNYFNQPNEILLYPYLDSILVLQSFLKQNSIEYDFYFMHQQLSYFKTNEDGFLIRCLDDDFVFKTNTGIHFHLPPTFKNDYSNFNENNNIEIIAPFFKRQIDLLDFDNFWFYEENGIQRGGLDEWTLLNTDWWGFFDIPTFKEHSGIKNYQAGLNSRELFTCMIPNFGNHPNLYTYFKLSNDIMKHNKFYKINENFISVLDTLVKEDIITNDNGLLPTHDEYLSFGKKYYPQKYS